MKAVYFSVFSWFRSIRLSICLHLEELVVLGVKVIEHNRDRCADEDL
jgi:hypothetical protein